MINLARRSRRQKAMAERSRAGREHMARLAGLPCAICGTTPVHVHHIREGQGTGQRASDFLTIPLCPDHHQGTYGIHGLGRRGFEAMYKTTELDLLAQTIEKVTACQ